MHFIGSSCSWNLGTTFSSSASFFPGERVGTMQLGSPRRTRPSVSVASLLVPRVYKPPAPHLRCISWSWSWSWSSSGDRDGVATNTGEPPESYLDRVLVLVAHTCVVHLHAHSWLVYVRRDIILAKSKHLRDFLRESSSGSAVGGSVGGTRLLSGKASRGGKGGGWWPIDDGRKTQQVELETKGLVLIDDSAWGNCYYYEGFGLLLLVFEFFAEILGRLGGDGRKISSLFLRERFYRGSDRSRTTVSRLFHY